METNAPAPSEAPKATATATRRTPKPPAAAPQLIGDIPDADLPGPEAPEFHQPITLLAIDSLGGQNQTFPSFDKAFLPLLSEFVSLLAKASPSVAGFPVTGVATSRLPSASLLTLRRGPRGKKVIVTAIDADVYAGSIQQFQEFDTGMAASQALGSSYNSVNKALHNSGGAPAAIDGVTFEYSDDYMARVNADVRGD